MKHWSKLRTMVGAWTSTEKTKYRDVVLWKLAYWGRELPHNSNWWWQKIGVPRQAVRVINNMKGGVPNETMAVLSLKLGMTGQKLADAAMLHLWKGLYYNDKKWCRMSFYLSCLLYSPHFELRKNGYPRGRDNSKQ